MTVTAASQMRFGLVCDRPVGSPPSRLEWTFEAKAGGTQAVLVQSEVPSSQAKSYRQGWIDYYWDQLKKYFGLAAKDG